MNKYTCLIICITMFSKVIPVSAQHIQIIHQHKGISFRGLSVVNDNVLWVSGNNGTIGRSLDSGKTWEWLNPEGHEKRDFRDIEAFDKNTAIAMAVGEPAIMLKTEDGGRRWKQVFIDNRPGMFLDAIEFWNEQSGIVIGDPIDKRFFIARTFDGGSNWRALAPELLPEADSGEACFAASGTNIRALDRDEACFVSGGKRSRLFWKGNPVDLPILKGKESRGANSVAVWYKKVKFPIVAVVGGDFAADTLRSGNFILSGDGGRSWKQATTPPNGYRSCIEFLSKKKLIACGVGGVDLSPDQGNIWKQISETGFHVCRKAKKGKAVFLAGGDGRIGKLVEP